MQKFGFLDKLIIMKKLLEIQFTNSRWKVLVFPKDSDNDRLLDILFASLATQKGVVNVVIIGFMNMSSILGQVESWQ